MENIISLDTETTGLSAKNDEMLSVAICNAWTGETLWNSFYKPDRALSWPDAQAVNGITPDMVKDCKSITRDVDELRRLILGADAVVVYNAAFDLPFLQAVGVIRDGDTFACYDPMLDFAEEYGEWDYSHNDMKWQKLTTAAEYVGYEWQGNAHDALADCRASAAVWLWLWKRSKANRLDWEA